MKFRIRFKEKIFTGEPGEEDNLDADFSPVGGWNENIEAETPLEAVEEANARCRQYEEKAKATGETIRVSCEVEVPI